MLPGTPEQNLETIWKDIARLYAEKSTQNKYWVIRMNMFHTKSQPKMKGKAAEVKDLIPVAVGLWERYYNKELLIHRQILVVLKGSFHMDYILAHHPEEYAFPPTVADDLVSTCCITLSTWKIIFDYFKNENMQPPLFGLTSKAHMLMHCCDLSR